MVLDEGSSVKNRQKHEVSELLTGIVFSGGGARGAYSIGVVTGILDVLGLAPEDRSPFDVFAGTSAGSINAAWLAAYADKGNMERAELTRHWLGLDMSEHIRFDPANLLRPQREGLGRSLLSSEPIERFLIDRLPWERLHHNLREGHAHALLLTATELGSGRSVWFTQVTDGAGYTDWRDRRRTMVEVDISLDHVMASGAIPFVFPARRIDGAYYCDGGVRFKTPISAAIRAGAERLVVISLRSADELGVQLGDAAADTPPGLLEQFGQVFGALSFDSAEYDIERLQAINQIVDVLDEELAPEQRLAFTRALEQRRGAAWKKVPVLAFNPSIDFKAMAVEYAARIAPRVGAATRGLIELLGRSGRGGALSFLLFDHEFTGALLEQGREDALARRDEIVEFFTS